MQLLELINDLGTELHLCICEDLFSLEPGIVGDEIFRKSEFAKTRNAEKKPKIHNLSNNSQCLHL